MAAAVGRRMRGVGSGGGAQCQLQAYEGVVHETEGSDRDAVVAGGWCPELRRQWRLGHAVGPGNRLSLDR